MDDWIKTRGGQLWERFRPSRWRKRMNFITIHYMYLMGMAILGSILIYPAGNASYIDSFFFGMGSVTQSGLNPIDVNNLNLYQQVVIYFLAMLTNPIFINTFVVFVRLYWFEKRFQHIVRESIAARSSRSRTRTMSRNKTADDRPVEEKGVNGRNIVVLHGSGKPIEPAASDHPLSAALNKPTATTEAASSTEESGSTSLSDHPRPSPQSTPMEPAQSFHRNITFADEIESPISGRLNQLPRQLSPEQHIAFLEYQRNPTDKQALRIPGPREFDRGQQPEAVDESAEETDLFPSDPARAAEPSPHQFLTGHAPRRATIQDTAVPSARKMTTSSEPRPQRSNTAPFRRRTLGADDEPTSASGPRRFSSFMSFRREPTGEIESTPYLSWQPTIGRNSAFVDLTEEQREELGGIEYRSLKTLAVILITYFLFWHLFGVITFLPWIYSTQPWAGIVDSDSINRGWWGVFTPATLFNDLGFTLTADSMIEFQGAVLPLLIGTFLIIIGNTGFPCLLRFMIWALQKIVPVTSAVWEELRFLLDHPRRCFTLLFPSSATWVLFGILVLLNGIDLFFFVVLDLNDSEVTSIPGGMRVLNGLFQAASTRTAGTAVVNLANLHPAIQVSYLIMMYISVFPIAISVRRTNVYEEKSLGIYAGHEEEHEHEHSHEPSYVGAHLRRQLSFDLWFIFLGLFIVAIAEGSKLIREDDDAFSLFSCLFEIVSAYGTVGLSLGYTNTNASLSAQFTTVSKLVITAMMLRGRHRGLPYQLDRAILLPSENLNRKENEDATRRHARRPSSVGDMRSIARTSSRATHASGREETGVMPTQRHTSVRSSAGAAHALSPHPTQAVGRMMAGVANAQSHVEDSARSVTHPDSATWSGRPGSVIEEA